jgi:hypothetical protein
LVVADSKSLSIIGFMLGGVTAAVMTIGLLVVQSHIDGRLKFDEVLPPVTTVSLPTIVR